MQLKDATLLRQKCYVDGAWADAESGKTIPVKNPANGEVLGTIPNMGAKETRPCWGWCPAPRRWLGS